MRYSTGLFLTRADAAGTSQNEIAIDVAGHRPSLVWDGTRYAIAWQRDGNVYFAATCP